MGCGGSKQEAEAVPPPRTARPKTGQQARPKTSQQTQAGGGRPPRPVSPVRELQSRSGHDSARPKTKSAHSQSRSGSSHGKPTSRSGTSHGGRSSKSEPRAGTSSGQKRGHGTVPERILEEHHQPAEDDQIVFEFQTLGTYTLNHALNYYHSEGSTSVRRTIGERILGPVVANKPSELEGAASGLFAHPVLQRFAKVPNDQRRRQHLDALCAKGIDLLRSISSNPARWTIGSWDYPDGRVVVYPSFLRNGQEVVRSEAS